MAERWSLWLIGILYGGLAAFVVAIFGVPMLALTLAGLAGGAVAVRSLALLSGGLVGAGLTYSGLLIRADLACRAADQRIDQACQGPDLAPYLAQGATVGLLGLVLGLAAVVHRRRTGTPDGRRVRSRL